MDAFLLLSYGAPETKAEVIPFLENLFRNKPVSPSVIDQVAEKYYDFARSTGRFSPLNGECRALLAGILREFNSQNKALSVYWGNLFWEPLLEETIAEMARDGVQHAACFATSAFDCTTRNQYDEMVQAACQKWGSSAPKIEMLPIPFQHPLFIEAQSDRLLEALAWAGLEAPFEPEPNEPRTSEMAPSTVRVLFSAHSVPTDDTNQSRYCSQLQQTCQLVAEKCGPIDWELVFQSRGVRGGQWLGPEIKDRVLEISKEGRYRSIVVSPIGFFCENMETARDLDLEIGELCEECGLSFVRALAVGAHPKICRMIREMTFS